MVSLPQAGGIIQSVEIVDSGDDIGNQNIYSPPDHLPVQELHVYSHVGPYLQHLASGYAVWYDRRHGGLGSGDAAVRNRC
jgi:hypothetical protein